MDLLLSVADNIILDKVWSQLVPSTAIFPTISTNWNQSLYPVTPEGSLSSAASAWLSLVSHLPHPPIEEFLIKQSESPHYQTPWPLTRFDSPPAIPSAWPRSYIPRQLISISVITTIGIHLLYFLFATLSYYLIFDKRMMRHPRFLKNQIRQEIMCSLRAFPGMTALTLPFFQLEVMGYSKLYDDPKQHGYTYLVLSVPL
jgi:lathosterol oxidase